MLQNKEKFITTINTLSHDGRGIADINGKKIFLDNGLPNEEVAFIYTRKHSSYDEGMVIEVLKSSPQRVTPKCQHFDICGGCCLQHMSHSMQLALKQQVLLEQLRHFGNSIPQEILEPITSEPWHYRTKARLGVKYVYKKNKVLVGFHEKNGRYLADIEACPILHEKIGNKIKALGDLISHLSIYQDIPQIEIAIGDEKPALIVRHLKDFSQPDLEILLVFAKQNNLQLFLQPKGIASIHCITDENPYLSYKLTEQKLQLSFHPTSFTQINMQINQKMIAKALELIDPQKQDCVLDLFCGIGNFTLPIAKHCAQAIGVEGDPQAIQLAQLNTLQNNIKNAEFFTADLNHEINNMSWAQQKFHKILLDPPRTGALNIIQQIKHFSPQKIVYVSCNPATLARDAKELLAQEFTLKKVGIIDMFPHTNHVETIALFEKC